MVSNVKPILPEAHVATLNTTLPLSHTDTPFGSMSFLSYDDPIGKSLSMYGEWARGEIELLCRLVRRGDTVIDVGANIGTHTLALAKYVGEAGNVIAFEPQPEIFAILTENVTRNNLAHVNLLLAGASNVAGAMYLPKANYASTANFGAIALDKDCGEREIQVFALDQTNVSACGLIKIDAEGMEREVIDGAMDILSTFHPALYLEINEIGNAFKLFEKVSGLGYRSYLARTKAFNPSNFKRNDQNFFGVATETSLLCVHHSQDIPYLGTSALFELIELESFEKLASEFMKSPRYGDKSDFARDPTRLNEEINRLTDAIHAAQKEKDRSVYRSTLLDRQIDCKDAEIDVLRHQLRLALEVHGELRLAKEAEKSLREMEQSLRNELISARDLSNQLLNSKSWAITRPLRVARRFLKI